MPDYIIDGAILTDIANAVREKTGATEPIVPENIAEMLRNVEGDYERGYAEGYKVGNAEGYEDGRSSLDVLPTLELEQKSSYYGKSFDSFGNQNLVVLFTLKKGKSVPAGFFGAIYQRPNGGTSATWVVSNGEYNNNSSVRQIVPSEYEWSMIGCYPANQETWDAFMDAFDARVERVGEEV